MTFPGWLIVSLLAVLSLWMPRMLVAEAERGTTKEPGKLEAELLGAYADHIRRGLAGRISEIPAHAAILGFSGSGEGVALADPPFVTVHGLKNLGFGNVVLGRKGDRKIYSWMGPDREWRESSVIKGDERILLFRDGVLSAFDGTKFLPGDDVGDTIPDGAFVIVLPLPEHDGVKDVQSGTKNRRQDPLSQQTPDIPRL